MVERNGRIWSEKKTPQQNKKYSIPPPPANLELLRGFEQRSPGSASSSKAQNRQRVEQPNERDSYSDNQSKSPSTPTKTPDSRKSASLSPEERFHQQQNTARKQWKAQSSSSSPSKLSYRDTAPPELTLPAILDTSFENVQGDGPVSPLGEDNVYFMGDEIGELALGLGDGGEYIDAVWSFDEEDDELLEDKNQRKQKIDIRRNISQSITSRNNPVPEVSPRGLGAELEDAIKWMEQQQVYRLETFERNKKNKSRIDVAPTKKISIEKSPKRIWLHDNDIAGHETRISPSSGLKVITGVFQEDDVDEEYPVTPSHPSHKKNHFDFLDLPEMTSPKKVAPSSKKNNSYWRTRSKPAKEPENEYEVKTSLPEPDSSWYKNFFGTSAKPSYAPELDTFKPKRQPKPQPTSMMSRLSSIAFYSAAAVMEEGEASASRQLAAAAASASKDLNAQPDLPEVMDEQELLAIAGYKDFGNGLAAC